MKIYHCDSCHCEVNDYAHWYNDQNPRSMYELKCIHEFDSDTFEGMVFCHECIRKLIEKGNEPLNKYGERCRHCKNLGNTTCQLCKDFSEYEFIRVIQFTESEEKDATKEC